MSIDDPGLPPIGSGSPSAGAGRGPNGADVSPVAGDGRPVGRAGPDLGAEPAPRARSSRGWLRHPWRIAALVFVLVGLVVIVGGFVWVRSEADPSGPPGSQVIVTVAPGTGVSTLASTLADKGVIGSSLAYRVWGQFYGVPGVLAGTYAFNKNVSFATVDSVISAGPNVFRLDIPPGFTVREVAERVGDLPGHDQGHFAAVADGGTVHSPWQPVGSTNLDGLLGTGDYVVVPGETDTELLTSMVDRFDNLADQVDLASGSAALGYTPYQMITIASIVEKEGVIGKNLGPVARVILNRLQAGMPLQMDSTVLYAEGRDGGTVTSADEQLRTPYNTYLNHGLTPTPICFPSKASLQAALHPPAGSWLYFVVVESDGTEAFVDTFAAQEANEALAKQRGLP